MPAVDQTSFRHALLDVAQPVPAGLVDGAGRPAGRRYSVYRNNVAVSLQEALATGFPAVAGLIGDENFARVAGVYLRQEQPGSPLMMQYGAGFPAFLAAFDPLAHLGYLADVARIDLAMRQSYHAADASPMDPGQLQGLSDTALMAARLHLAPSVRIVRSRWPVLSVWRFTMQPDQPAPQASAEDVLIARPDFDPAPHLLPPGGAAFVTALAEGRRFGDAVEVAGEDFDLPATLGLLLETRALVALELEGEV